MAIGRRQVLFGASVLGIGGASVALYRWYQFPSEKTPEGAYLRIVHAVTRGEPASCFAYLEEEAQHACFTLQRFARRAFDAIQRDFPAEARARAAAGYEGLATHEPGPGTWAHLARTEGYLDRLRRDLSGVSAVELAEPRATLTTARGTRYSFRRRPNGIWGLTLFTAALVRRARTVTHDVRLIEEAAADYRAAAAAAP